MFRQSTPSSKSTRPSFFRPGIESLEDRRLMATGISASLSAGVLTVTGTEKADIIILKQEGKVISVYDDTKLVRNFTVGQAQSVVVNALAGNDYVKLFGNSFNVLSIPATLKGGGGNDYLEGGKAADNIYGEGGNDNLMGGDGVDSLYGGDGNDRIEGGNQNDYLYGGNGNDKLWGNAGVDSIFGQDGDDYLNGGASKDYLNGGSGTDTFRLDMFLPSGFSLTDDEIGGEPAEVAGAFLTNPTSDDLYAINQEGTPTCAFLSALAAAAQWTGKFSQYGSANNDLLSRISYDSGRDEYGVKLYVNNSWATIWVNSDWTEGKDPGSALWVTLYQKAFLKVMDVVYKRADGSFLPADQWKSTSGKNWTSAGIALEMFTTDKSTRISSGDLDAQSMQTAMSQGWLYTASAKDSGVSSTFVANHSYAVQRVFKQNGQWMVQLYNPWGHDRSGSSLDGKDDGSISVTWTQFKANISGVYKN
jgi:hypothetical protein